MWHKIICKKSLIDLFIEWLSLALISVVKRSNDSVLDNVYFNNEIISQIVIQLSAAN